MRDKQVGSLLYGFSISSPRHLSCYISIKLLLLRLFLKTASYSPVSHKRDVRIFFRMPGHVQALF